MLHHYTLRLGDLLKSKYLLLKYSCLIRQINAYQKKLNFGAGNDGVPFLKYNDQTFYGFHNSPQDDIIYELIKSYFKHGFKKEYYRLTKDFITRYIYPHMLPYLRPECSLFFMSGFHGQHKDSILDISDISIRNELRDAFSFEPDDVVVDGGAYIGFGDLKVCQLVPEGKIVAVEAERTCFKLLKMNLEQNNISNVVPVNKALWKKDEIITLKKEGLQANTVIEEIVDAADCQEIEGVTIDSVLDRFSVNKVDFVSLTLNGAEAEALEGMVRTIAEFRPRIRLAGWYYRGKRQVWELCKEKLVKYGYKIFVGKRGSLYAYA